MAQRWFQFMACFEFSECWKWCENERVWSWDFESVIDGQKRVLTRELERKIRKNYYPQLWEQPMPSWDHMVTKVLSSLKLLFRFWDLVDFYFLTKNYISTNIFLVTSSSFLFGIFSYQIVFWMAGNFKIYNSKENCNLCLYLLIKAQFSWLINDKIIIMWLKTPFPDDPFQRLINGTVGHYTNEKSLKFRDHYLSSAPMS